MPASTPTAGQHWDGVYATKGAEQVSWFQSEPALSLELIDSLGLDRASPIVDVGGGASTLSDKLLDRGYADVTVLDISAEALHLAQTRLGPGDRTRYCELATSSITIGGYLLIATFAPDGPERCSGLPVARYSAKQLAAQLEPGFTTVTTRREQHHAPAGGVQPFTWLLARRTDQPGQP